MWLAVSRRQRSGPLTHVVTTAIGGPYRQAGSTDRHSPGAGALAGPSGGGTAKAIMSRFGSAGSHVAGSHPSDFEGRGPGRYHWILCGEFAKRLFVVGLDDGETI
jgi:hypothetical protein